MSLHVPPRSVVLMSWWKQEHGATASISSPSQFLAPQHGFKDNKLLRSYKKSPNCRNQGFSSVFYLLLEVSGRLKNWRIWRNTLVLLIPSLVRVRYMSSTVSYNLNRNHLQEISALSYLYDKITVLRPFGAGWWPERNFGWSHRGFRQYSSQSQRWRRCVRITIPGTRFFWYQTCFFSWENLSATPLYRYVPFLMRDRDIGFLTIGCSLFM